MNDVQNSPAPISPARSDRPDHPNGDRPDDPVARTAFRLECKYVALTYPNCEELSFDELFAYLTTGIEPIPDYVILARELHQSGVPHFHALVYFQRGIRTRNQRFFDFGGRHPNVQSCRSAKNWYDYCRKEGDHREFGPLPPKLGSNGGGDWGDCLAKASSRDDFLERVKTTAPREYILFFDKICTFADQHFTKVDNYETPDVDYRIPEPLADWARENISEVGVIDQHSYSDVSLILESSID